MRVHITAQQQNLKEMGTFSCAKLIAFCETPIQTFVKKRGLSKEPVAADMICIYMSLVVDNKDIRVYRNSKSIFQNLA